MKDEMQDRKEFDEPTTAIKPVGQCASKVIGLRPRDALISFCTSVAGPETLNRP